MSCCKTLRYVCFSLLFVASSIVGGLFISQGCLQQSCFQFELSKMTINQYQITEVTYSSNSKKYSRFKVCAFGNFTYQNRQGTCCIKPSDDNSYISYDVAYDTMKNQFPINSTTEIYLDTNNLSCKSIDVMHSNAIIGIVFLSIMSVSTLILCIQCGFDFSKEFKKM